MFSRQSLGTESVSVRHSLHVVRFSSVRVSFKIIHPLGARPVERMSSGIKNAGVHSSVPIFVHGHD